ncbi:hypothetical protein ACFV2N_43040 [Streptomyces sp. NPDC059680]|uniref:hypothetical protein n=1 Tax=Streptomyces sp. NPDC059680 TaxID=3346904 RepID=UPI00368C2FBD
MGTVIAAAAIAAPQPEYTSTSSVQLAGQAAHECLTRAGRSVDAIGVLINVGIYREHNTMEPAMAALVQKEAGIHLDYFQRTGTNATFSFDLMNGACGVLNAVQVSEALLASGSTDRVLVTAADVHPSGSAGKDPHYPYSDLGAALLLERSAEPTVGFGPVRHRGAPGASGGEGYLDMSAMGTSGRSNITVRSDQGGEDWVRQLLDLTVALVTDYADDEGLDLSRTLLVCNRPVPGFPDELARRVQIPRASVVATEAPLAMDGAPHTAAPVLGYLQAVEQGLLEGFDQMMFVCCGTGPTVACVSYRPKEQ